MVYEILFGRESSLLTHQQTLMLRKTVNLFYSRMQNGHLALAGGTPALLISTIQAGSLYTHKLIEQYYSCTLWAI